MKRYTFALVLVSLVTLSACDAVKKSTGPTTDLPTIVTFSASPNIGKAPLNVRFQIDTTEAVKCEIEGIGSVPCVGSAEWPVSVSTDFRLFARNAAGEGVSRSTRVTITP